MDHNGLYTDLDSFASITSCGTTNNSFNDTCPTLPSLNNFKYQQTNLSSNIYQQPVQTIHDQHHNNNHSAKASSASSSTLPQTQININNCNNNIFFPHDDGIFDANSATCAATSNSGGNNNNQKSNFHGYVRKELGSSGGGGGDNITYNINNINTNIVNNINNPTNLVNGSDIFGGNQFHQINKNGETIINFTNNNLNSTGSSSMPTDTVSSTSQNYYGYQSNSSQGQQTVYESSVQSQSQSQSSSFLDPNLSASKSNMGSTGLYPAHPQSSLNHTMGNAGTYLPGNTNTIPSEHPVSSVDPFSEYPETLSTAKIINNFESKNPLKYPTANRASGTYYKSSSDYPTHQYHPVGHLPPHNYPGLYPTNPIPSTIPKPSAHNYDPYPRVPRNTAPHYQMQHYTNPPSAHPIDEQHSSRLNYNRPSAVPVHPSVGSYHHSHTLQHPHPPNNYGNFYPNGYGTMPYPTYPQMPAPHYANPLIRNESCSKSSPNYSKTGAVALSPVEHTSYTLPHATNYSTPKKDFYNESHYYPPAPHPYYDEQLSSALNSCAKKASSRSKANTDVYNTNGYNPDHLSMPHHPQNGNVMRNVNVGYQTMPKHYSSGNSYPLPSMPSNHCDLVNPYQNFNYHYKNGEHAKMVTKMNPALSSKQFKSYGHFEPLPHPHVNYGHPQYHTMQVKHPEKIKISLDLEEQINSSKIPKYRDSTHPSYGFDPHQHHFYQYHHIPPRNPTNDNDPKNSIANINISLRDFLSTWNEIDDDEEASERRPTHGALEDLTEHMERTIMREYNPMFVQKATDSFINANDVPSNNAEKSQLSELESGIINEGTEKLYVLESIDVPLSELNKYKHLSVINKLPENVVINDKELYADVDSSMKFIEEIDLTREKLYKSEFELEFEACQEQKITKPLEEPTIVKDEKILVEKDETKVEADVEVRKSDSEEKPAIKKKTLKVKAPKMKSVEAKITKTKQSILKLKKDKILKSATKDPRKVRIAKRVKKYSLNQRTSSIKTLQSICVDFLNTSAYRNFAREQLSIINKFSKMRILKDFKKKFNFEAKKPNPTINQKLNHSVRINSLREICGNLLKDNSGILDLNESEDNEVMQFDDFLETNENDFPTLKELSRRVLTEMDINVVEDDYLCSPSSLKEICETFIYSHDQYFLIEEVSSVPKLQDLCKSVLSETNIFINIDEESDGIFTLNNEPEESLQDDPIIENADDDEPIYIVEENSGKVGELFESENLNSFEKSEILRKIQRVANIEDDDEIIRAIGELHRDDVESINNNNSNVFNKNISCANEIFPDANEFSMSNGEMKFDSEMSFMSYMDTDDLMHSVQYEEIISVNDKGDKATKKIVEILRHKYLNRSEVRQTTKTIKTILGKSLTYQRKQRFHNAKRREQINALKQQARAALSKLKESKNCDNVCLSENSSCEESGKLSSTETAPVKESQNYAKDDTKAQSHQILFNQESTAIFNDSIATDYYDVQAELNFPKLPTVFPSINEYKIDRKSSNRSEVKDKTVDVKQSKLTFAESLLNIEKMYGRANGENGKSCEENKRQDYYNKQRRSSRNYNRSSTSSSSSSSSSRRYYDKTYERRRRHSPRNDRQTRRSTRSKSREHKNDSSRQNYHNSSRQNCYKPDQMKHSGARRLVIPSYKIYDKDLDVKLKIMPFVRIEREDKVDGLVKK